MQSVYPSPPSSRAETPAETERKANKPKSAAQKRKGKAMDIEEDIEVIEVAKIKDNQERIWHRDEIAEKIVQGKLIVIHQKQVYDLTQWANNHPGGSLAILHMVGRDATAQINAYHDKYIQARMKQFCIGSIGEETLWDPLVPPIQLGWDHKTFKETQDTVTTTLQATIPSLALKDATLPHCLTIKNLEPIPNEFTSLEKMHRQNNAYHQLHKEIIAAGLYKAPKNAYQNDILRYIALATLSLTAYSYGYWFISALALGFLWQQLVFTVHDAGHLGLSGKYSRDTSIGCGIASFLGGLSVLWWKHNHNVHHIVCNDVEHDPDIQHVPFLAISSQFYDHVHSSYYSRQIIFDKLAKAMIPIQHMMYYLIMSLARFNLYVLSYTFLIQESKKTKYHRIEILGVAVFWTWYLSLLYGLPDWKTRLFYVLVSHMITGILHVQITLSHFGMPTNDQGSRESYASLQLRTTMDVECPWYLDFFHGGLQNQVSHHLFPRLPRHNLPIVREMVRKFAKENDIVYTMHTFSKGNGVVLGVLKTVADQVILLAEVAKAGAEGKIVIELDGF